ncbi:hypothetical protein PRIPAC_83473 [Pristionchus pacificus]|uniref:TIL domain-containing protein n=1 Tax=Pristionchus pacificus TaxID=54126 RepID=A0A2A6CEH8_PRIPA|nr:hypothetical protein PRIPAC_83473 [Pristionchus pacificus]|eukprot:PDM76529.1 hypothetical protein PRIPAC_42895 [Pristionchus pacificus]
MHLLSTSTLLCIILGCISAKTCRENQELTMGGVCPPRCQVVYKMCILPAVYNCYCKEGFIWNFELTECIPQKDCDAKWKEGEYKFIVDKVYDEGRGYEISCDKMAVCDLSQIERDPNDATKIIDHTPIPRRFIEYYPRWGQY